MSRIDTVLAWQPDAVAAVADALVRHRRTLISAQEDLSAGAPPPGWVSAAQHPARRAHEQLTSALSSTTAQVRSVAGAADDAAAAVRSAQGELEAALAWAAGQGFRVDRRSGAVSDTACWLPEIARDRTIAIAEIADRIEQAVRAAEHADALLAAALDAAAAGTSAPRSGPGAGVPPMPSDASPAAANAWWRSLTPEQQEWVLAEHPEWLGNTDGIPAGIRDQANRALIDVYRTELEAEAARLRAQLDSNRFGGLFTNDDAALALVENKLAGLDAIEQVLALGGRQLLTLDITGSRQLMTAIAVGDVDTADHVAVFTPGFTSTVHGSLANYDRDMDNLARVATMESYKYGDGGSVATVSWMGYEAPQWGEWYKPGSDFVTSQDSANTGGAALAGFYRGIDASREVNPNLTALGHSYGSTTTGVAVQETTGVDSVVIFGSPGIGTGDVGDLQVPAGRVFQLEADWDGVADLGRFGGDPSRMDGLRSLSSDETQMDGRTLDRSTGHSAYLTQDTTSQHNIATVVVGAENRMIEVPR